MSRSAGSLFLYSSTNTLRSYLSRGMIVSNAVLREHGHERTLGNLSEQVLFLTHLTLAPELSRLGLEGDENLFPVLVELRLPEDSVGELPAYLLGIDGAVTEGDLKGYDPAAHLGAFVAGHLPFSMVSSLIFETERNRGAFYDPSPNLWFPESLYRDLSPAERSRFKNSLDTALVRQQGCVLDLALQEEGLDRVLALRERYKAAALMCVHSARTVVGDNSVNIDALAMGLFELEPEAVAALLPAKMRAGFEPWNGPGTEDLLSVLRAPQPGQAPDGASSVNRAVLRTAWSHFLGLSHPFSPDIPLLMQRIRRSLQNSGAEEEIARLDRLEQHFLGTNEVSLSRELEAVPASLPAQKALIMVLKNSSGHRVSFFMEELGLFRLSREERRYALVLYAALNGLNDFEGKFKDDLWANRYAEAYAARWTAHPKLISTVYTPVQYSACLPRVARLPAKNLTGYGLAVRPRVDLAEIRNLLSKRLPTEEGRQKAYGVLAVEIRSREEIGGLTAVEYHQLRSDLLPQQAETGGVLRFRTPAKEVKTLNLQRFRSGWLDGENTLAERYKKSRDRRILLAVYEALGGEVL